MIEFLKSPLGKALIIYLATGIATALFKPRTPEQYAALPPRLAAFLKAISALGLDLPKLIEGAGQLVTKSDKRPSKTPPNPPSAPPPPVLFVGVVLSLGVSACSLWTRQTARDVLSVVQISCIIAHQELPDSDVAKVCAITEPFLDPMRRVLMDARHASAKAAAVGCAHEDVK